MARRAYARRYSQAVFEIALETNKLDGWQSDLRKIADLTKEASLTALLESPKISFDIKARLLSERLGDVNPLSLNLAYLLLTRGKINIAGDLFDEFQRLLDSHRGIEQAEVTTAFPLEDEDRQKLSEQLGAIVNKRIVLKPMVDPGVIGGFIARIGGKLLDGSTHSRLMALKTELAGGSK